MWVALDLKQGPRACLFVPPHPHPGAMRYAPEIQFAQAREGRHSRRDRRCAVAAEAVVAAEKEDQWAPLPYYIHRQAYRSN